MLFAKTSSVSFSTNNATYYGSDMASDISSVGAQGGSSASRRSSTIMFKGGNAMVGTSALAAVMKDHFGNVVSDNRIGLGVKCFLSLDNGLYLVKGEQLSLSASGISEFTNLAVAGSIGKVYTAGMSCRWSRDGVSSEEAVYSAQLEAARCDLGEKTKMITKPGTSDRVALCERCEATTYSEELDSTRCHDCPKGAKCPGGSAVIANKEYWNGGQKKSEVYECRVTGICNGGVNNTCASGHQPGSRLCAQCVDNYYMLNDECTKCPARGFAALLPTLVGIAVLVTVLLIAWKLFMCYLARKSAGAKQSGDAVVVGTAVEMQVMPV